MDASGKTALEIQQDLTTKLQEFIKQPVITVIVKQINSLKISVLGEVRKPDVYKIKNRVTVLDAVAMAGGFTDLARPTHVVVLRKTGAGPIRFVVNVNQLVDEKNGTPFYLEPSDTVYVEGR
jgi:polysaccharide export outer membrane protein